MLDTSRSGRRRLDVFVSSAMQELQAERQVISAALADLQIDAWVYESDAGARDQSTRVTYLQELQAADLYIGVFWKRYGEYTIDEYRQAAAWQKPRLIFVKRAQAEERDAPLRAFLDEVTGVNAERAAGWFDTLDDLREIIKSSVQGWQADVVHRLTALDVLVPFQVEPLGDQYIERTRVLELARASWLPTSDDGPPPVTRAAFHGLGGSGKSIMARAFAHDRRVRRVFRDGVLSATLRDGGEQPIDTLSILSAWGQALRDREMAPAGYLNAITASNQLRTLLQNESCLLLVDDAWDADQVNSSFLVGGPRCLLLITTRSLAVAEAIGANAIELSSMTTTEGLSLIEQRSGAPLSSNDREIALALGEEIGWLPLALDLMAAQATKLEWRAYRERWRTQRLTALRRGRRGTGRDDNVADSIELSYDILDKDDAVAYRQLAVFGANTQFPATAASALWNTDDGDAQELLDDLSGQALLRRIGSPDATRYMLHSLLHEFLLERLEPEIVSTHSALVDGYLRRSAAGWAGVPEDGYFRDRVAFHLVAAERVAELWQLLGRPWMEARFTRGMSHASFLADLRVGLQVARREPIDVAAFVRCTVISVMVSAVASDDPPNLPVVLAELGDIDIALDRTATIARPGDGPQAYIDIADVLLDRQRVAEAAVAAERAMAVANDEVQTYRGIKMLAQAAACLGRCGRDTSATLARARTIAVDGSIEEGALRVEALGAVIEGYAALSQPDIVAEVVRQIMQMISEAAPDDSRLMIVGACRALRVIGAVAELRTLADVALARVRDGSGGYPLSSVARALAGCGELDAAISAARVIPENYLVIEVLAEIATNLASRDRQQEASELFHEAVQRLESEVRADVLNWRYAKPLLAAAGTLGTAASLEYLLPPDASKDRVQVSWFLAGLARAHYQAGAAPARVAELAAQSLAALRQELAKGPGPVGGDGTRAEAADFLAEAGAIPEAVSMADDIEDVQDHKKALASIARHLSHAGRTNEARELLRRVLVAGRPDPATHVVCLASAAEALARLGDTGRALATIDSCLPLAASLDATEALLPTSACAVEIFIRCGLAERAREMAAKALDLLRRPGIFDAGIRNQIVELAARANALEAFEATLSPIPGWFGRRRIARGVLRAFNIIGQPERGRQFFDDLDATKDEFTPWNEAPKVDGLARLFSVPDEQARRWARETANTVHAAGPRSLLQARFASTLAKESHPDAMMFARAAMATVNDIHDQSARDQWANDVAFVFARAGQRELVGEARAGLRDAATSTDLDGELAMALADGGRVAEATATLQAMPAGPARHFWVETVAQRLLESQEYDPAKALYTLLSDWPQAVVAEYAETHVAVVMAQRGQSARAREAADLISPRVETWGDEAFSLVIVELALCYAYLGMADQALPLVGRAQRQDRGSWGPLVSATAAACRELAGDRAGAQQAVADTIRRLQLLPPAVPFRIESLARIWGASGVDGFDSLVGVVRGVGDEGVRAGAIAALAKGSATALRPAQLTTLIDEASTIADEWARAEAFRALIAPASAGRNRPALRRLLQITRAIQNDWAASDVIVALASAVAPLEDEELLNEVLGATSEQMVKPWKAVAAVAETARLVLERGERERAALLIQRAIEAGTNEDRYDERERTAYDAETIACLSLLGRHDEAAVVLARVITTARQVPSGFFRDAIVHPVEASVDDMSPATLATLVSLTSGECSSMVASAALRLALVGETNRAAALVATLRTGAAAVVDAADRSSILFLCARTLAALGRSEEGVRCALDALDACRTLEARAAASAISLMAEALADLGHKDGVTSLLDALETTFRWWDRAGATAMAEG